MKNRDFDKIIDFFRLSFSIILLLIAFFSAPLSIILIFLVFFLMGVDIKIDKGIEIKLGTMFKSTKK